MEKDIGKINKNDMSDIVVRVDDFGGKVGLTIREFITSDRYTGFTKSGVRIPANEFLNFKQMINSIDEKELLKLAEELEEGMKAKEPAESKPAKPARGQKTLKSSKEELPDY